VRARPDLIFTGGRIFTGTSGRPVEPASVAVSDGRISAVGADAGVRDLAGPNTDTVDLAGGLLIPGFQDAHVHPVQGGMERLSCDLSDFSTAPEYLEAIGSYAASAPSDVTWITGGGWMLAAFPGGLPTAAALDAVVPARPVFLPNRDHHGAWVNTAALERAGITADTPDPGDGRIERDASGTPTGLLHEGAMDLVGALVPPASVADQVTGLLAAQSYLHSVGITSWQDAIVGSYANITDTSAAYLACLDSGTLTAKVVGALWWDRTRGAEQIADLLERRSLLTQGRFAATSVKIMQDGIAENFTAGMTAPYLDACGCRTANAGLSMVDPVALREYVRALDAEGFQVHVHAIGDRAIRESLDAFEATGSRRSGSSRSASAGRAWPRHHIAHLQVIHPDDIARFAALDVTATMQPLWATHEEQMDDLTIPFLGPERATWQYPFASLVRSGARLAAGSDWPVTSPDPLAGIHVAVNRRLPESGNSWPAFLPEQAIDVVTALTAYTAGSAYVNNLDDTGRIVEGTAADLVVLDRDIVSAPADEIAMARVRNTYVDGCEVYSA
jgi:predicted amidohydrolase YtcJ